MSCMDGRKDFGFILIKEANKTAGASVSDYRDTVSSKA